MHVIALDAAGLLGNAVVVGGNPALEQAFPLPVGKADAVERLQLGAQINDQIGFVGDDEALVALPLMKASSS